MLDEAAATSDPQLHERGSFTCSSTRRAAPTLGQDNEYVYKDLLGVTDDEYDELVGEGHVGTEYL